MNERPSAPLSGGDLKAPADARNVCNSPAQILNPDSDQVRALLEELDDVVFMAIRGDRQCLEQARTLWPEVVRQVGWEMVEESREQYLRYSTDIARRFEQDAIRDPARALAAIEVIELLMHD